MTNEGIFFVLRR